MSASFDPTDPAVTATDGRLSPQDCLAGGGAMGALMRSTDWSQTVFGPVSDWPQSLRTAISIMLESRFAMVVAWGPQFRFFYNDRYRPVLGTKHPASLGAAAAEIFPEIWPTIEPAFEGVRRGDAFAIDDWLLPLERNGYLENCWFTLSYSPIRDETGGVGGLLAIVAETTGRVEGERRLATLRELARRAADATTPDQACTNACHVFEANPIDVPFALIYLLDRDGTIGRLVCGTSVASDHPASIPTVNLDAGADDVWRLTEVVRTGKTTVLSNLDQRMVALPAGPYEEPTHTAVLLPLSRPGLEHPYGVLVAGVCPRRELDDRYRGFFDLAADHIATAISNAVALQEAQHRLEALAQIDRAKTAFFSNVSHEFRTPLTLMLGPTEAALNGADKALRDDDLEMVHRNQLRLLKLVNALLDFSRIEAGRAQATYQPTDVSALTRELAGAFRSAIEHAGLRFDVVCDAIGAPVYVDRDMWEKVVLNLLSNAFKFTLEGSIRIALTERDGRVELAVQDTGSGIPEEEVPRVFERFHRVEGARSRTHEGSGIGLALTYELVHLHGGDIAVSSRAGDGSTFTVRIPTGSAHLPQDRVSSMPLVPASTTGALGAAPFVEEATRWLPRSAGAAMDTRIAGPSGLRQRILVVDDNADMRDYLSRLLHNWDVETASNGVAALERVRVSPPDLILADVMMPELDGFGLLNALRANPATSHIPVLLLSARAGEEATVEGIAAGADDYIVKPFTARDVLARVEAQLTRAREREALRRQAESLGETNRLKDEFLATLSHELRTPLNAILGWSHMLRSGTLPPSTQQRALDALHRNAKAQTQLVEDLLDVSRIISGKLTIKADAVDLSTVIAGAIDAIRPGAGAKQVSLNVALDPESQLLVTGDADRLQQVVWNLLSNAVKFTPSAGRIDVEVRRAESRAELIVRDSGHGIEPAFLPHVFERFRQADSSPARTHGGLGLGLAIVKHLVEAHGGTVSADSAGRDHGATFVVRLPVRAVAQPAAAPVKKSTRSAAPTLAGARVLIVDDEADARELIRFVLESEGAEVTAAESAGAALHLLGRRTFDVLVADISMPDQDGYSLIRAVRSLSPARGGTTPAIAVTAYASLRERDEALDAGYHWHLPKPVEPEQLIAAVSGALHPRSNGPKRARSKNTKKKPRRR